MELAALIFSVLFVVFFFLYTEQKQRNKELLADLQKKYEGMRLYSAEYCEDIYADSFTTISIHRTEQRAHEAIKEHRESVRRKEKYPFELTENSRWRVDYYELQ